jgi:hypothetical protein
MSKTKLILIGAAMGVGAIVVLAFVIFILPHLFHATQQSIN